MAEWLLALCADLTPASAICLGLIPVGALILVLAFADTDPADFNPRPAIRRAIESGRFDQLLVTVGPVLAAVRGAALDAAALVLLLTTSPKGAMA